MIFDIGAKKDYKVDKILKIGLSVNQEIANNKDEISKINAKKDKKKLDSIDAKIIGFNKQIKELQDKVIILQEDREHYTPAKIKAKTDIIKNKNIELKKIAGQETKLEQDFKKNYSDLEQSKKEKK